MMQSRQPSARPRRSGFIEITERGRGGNAEMRRPSLYRITFLNERGSRAKPPTHEWQRIKTVEDAQRIADEARKAKSQNAVNNGRAAWRKQQAKKHFPVPETGIEAGPGNRDRSDTFPGPGNHDYRVGPETMTTSISREGRPSISIVSERQGGTMEAVREVVSQATNNKPTTPYPHLAWSNPTPSKASWKHKYRCEYVSADMAMAA